MQWAQPPTRLSRSLPRRWRGRSRGRRSCSCPCTPAGASVGSTEVFLVGDTSACGDRDGPRSFLPPPVRARGGPVGEHLVEPPQHQDVDPRGLAPFKCRRHIDALRLETGMRVSGQSLAANHPPALGAISTHKALDGTRSLKNASASVSTSRRVSRRRCASRPCRGNETRRELCDRKRASRTSWNTPAPMIPSPPEMKIRRFSVLTTAGHCRRQSSELLKSLGERALRAEAAVPLGHGGAAVEVRPRSIRGPAAVQHQVQGSTRLPGRARSHLSRGPPDVSCTWADEPPADHPIVVVHGPPGAEAAYFEGVARAALPVPEGAW